MKRGRPFPLRIRLVLLFTGVLAVLLALLGTILYQDTWNLLVETTAAHVRARAKPIIEHWLCGEPLLPSGVEKGEPAQSLDKIALPLARDLTSRDTVALVLNAGRQRLANGKRLPEEPDPAPPLEAYVRSALKGNNEVTYLASRKGIPFLVTLIPLRPYPGSRKILGVVQLTTSLASVRKTLVRHGVMFAGTGLAILALGALLGIVIISSSLGGLKRMADTCRAISRGDLDKRVALPKRNDEIGQLARAFDEMVTRIGETVAAQRRFAANAAHELRSPLTALRGSIEVLLRGAQDDPAAASRLIQGMHGEVTRLESLCERLLDLSHLEGMAGPHKRPIRLKGFFEEFFPRLRKMVPDHHLVLEMGPEAELLFDPVMFRQVLFNLVQNASQHTPAGGNIYLGWRLVAGPEGVLFWVKDEGEGVPPEDLPRIFEPFYRGRSGTASREGTGLGLNIVKTILSAHGGDVAIESVYGKGTKVTFRVPFT